MLFVSQKYSNAYARIVWHKNEFTNILAAQQNLPQQNQKKNVISQMIFALATLVWTIGVYPCLY